MTGLRVAVASIIQETNTFSPRASTLDDFRAQGLWLGEDAERRSEGSNTEIAGAIDELQSAGATPVPIIRAWAMSDGTLDADSLAELTRLLLLGIESAGTVDAVILCLHGALVADGCDAADAHLTRAVRHVIGQQTPLIVTHDLHANVTPAIIEQATAVVGFHTYPHIDQGDTGRRAAVLALRAVENPGIGTVLEKRRMVIPAETQAIADEPMAGLRQLADDLTVGPILDVSLFPVQPWLDVPWLGFGVTVTHADAQVEARAVARTLADRAWSIRDHFQLTLVPVDRAVAELAPAGPMGPRILVQSADSPTAGATADDATVIGALLGRPPGLRGLATVVDSPAVLACIQAGAGARVSTLLGATIDARWSVPIEVHGTVTGLGDEPVILRGASMTGQAIALGRWATLATDDGLSILLTERPAPTFDPQGFRHAGLEPADMDVVVVRSATMYRAGFRGMFTDSVVLDLPGVSTPAFGRLDFHRVPHPLFPLDAIADDDSGEGRE